MSIKRHSAQNRGLEALLEFVGFLFFRHRLNLNREEMTMPCGSRRLLGYRSLRECTGERALWRALVLQPVYYFSALELGNCLGTDPFGREAGSLSTVADNSVKFKVT